VATLRPLLRAIFHGSSAPGHGTSAAAQWGKGSSGHPNGGYIRGNSTRGTDEAFELATGKNGGGTRMGVTTVINHGRENGLRDDSVSEASGSIKETDGWNSSQSHLAEDPARGQQHQQGSIWNITVKKTVVQTTGPDAV
jgi:hypothetical protein